MYAEDHDLWFEVSPTDGRLRAHELDVVNVGAAGEAELRHAAHRVADPIQVLTTPGACSGASTLLYLGSGKFGVAETTEQQRNGRGNITVTVFRVVDSEMPVDLAERKRRRQVRGMNAGWLTAELERACADGAVERGRRRRRLCRINLWSRTYVVRGDAGRLRGPSLTGMLWM